MLQGLALTAGEYRAMAGGETAAGRPAVPSGVLGLELHVTEDGLRFRDPDTGHYLMSHAEAEAARAAAEARIAELEASLRDRGGP